MTTWVFIKEVRAFDELLVANQHARCANDVATFLIYRSTLLSQTSTFFSMRDNKLRRLSRLLIALRAKSGLSQKAAALGAGLSQSVYCSLEKGRRGNLQPKTIDAIARALDLDLRAREQLVWTVEHDRLIDQVMNGPVAAAAPLVSAALEISAKLLPAEAQGLQRYMEDLVAARQKLERVATTGAAIVPKEEVATMS